MRRPLLPGFVRPLVFAHRGFSAHAPENTMASFELAIKSGSPGIELDVHLSSDDQVIVFHDPDLQRLSGRPEKLHQNPYSFLKTVDIGSWHSDVYRNERMPLLKEVFEMAGGRVYFDIEIKHSDVHPNPIEQKILAIVKDFKMEDQCIISSFNPFCIRHIKKLDKKIPGAVIFSDSPDVPPFLRKGFGRWIANIPKILKPNWKQLTGRNALHFSKLYKIVPWTINDPLVAARMLALNVEGMIGDDPQMLIEAIV